MPEIHGNVGAIYWRPYIAETTIGFFDTSPDQLRDSGAGFVDAGFANVSLVLVSGATNASNNTYLSVATVAAKTIVLAGGEALVASTIAETITIVAALPGKVLSQFYNWRLTSTNDTHDVTDFSDDTWRTHLSGLSHWEASSEKHWDTTDNQNAWLSTSKVFRFFTRYDAAPATTDVYYYEGTGIVNTQEVTVSVDTVITQTMTMQGTGTLANVTIRSTAWPV